MGKTQHSSEVGIGFSRRQAVCAGLDLPHTAARGNVAGEQAFRQDGNAAASSMFLAPLFKRSDAMLDWLKWGNRQITSLAKPLDISQLRKRAKIVVIDDDKNAFPTKALQSEGFTIEYWSKVQTLQRLEDGDFDIIVLDIKGVATKISEQDGIGVLQQVKKVNPGQIIIAFSGETFDIGKTEFFRLADDVLAKPVDTLKCKQVLDHLIQTKFTVRHIWEGIVTMLRQEKVPEKTIAAFETQVYKAIQKGGSPDYSQIVKSTIEKADIALRVTGLLVKIATLCGL